MAFAGLRPLKEVHLKEYLYAYAGMLLVQLAESLEHMPKRGQLIASNIPFMMRGVLFDLPEEEASTLKHPDSNLLYQ